MEPSGITHMWGLREQTALIVREREIKYYVSFVDDPASHTLSLMDWYEREAEVFFRNVRFGVG